jgi:hypothetical protein
MSGVSLPTTTISDLTRRSSETPRRDDYSLNRMLNRLLNGAGGDNSNYTFAGSFAVLFIVILIFANMNSPATDVTSSPDHQGYVGTWNMKSPEHHRQVQERPTNVSLLIVGDAVSGYGYLSLVYFLRWGRWFDPGLEKSNLVNEGSFDNPFHKETFNEFFYQSNVMLQPYELCDCHKNADSPDKRKYTHENRYYHDPKYNNTVTFIHAFGEEISVHGRLLASDTYTDRWQWSTKEKGLMSPKWSKPEWSHDTWKEFITDYVGNMEPKPAFVTLQAGSYKNSFGPKDHDSTQALIDAMKKENLHAFWKTTSYMNTHLLDKEVNEVDQYMCDVLDSCLDVSWTKGVKKEHYWDAGHFYEPVYRVMNEDMLEVMGYLPENYTKYSRDFLID